MKMLVSILVALIGVAAIVFGVMFIMEAGNSRDDLATEVAPLQLSQVEATYDQFKADAAAKPTDLAKALRKTSMGLAKSNLKTIKFVQNAGYLNIALGAGFVLVGMFMFMKRN